MFFLFGIADLVVSEEMNTAILGSYLENKSYGVLYLNIFLKIELFSYREA